MKLLCPVCGSELNREDRRLLCSNNHSFDIARQGHVNLLVVQQKHSLNPGDTREQVLSRREFLDAGFYEPIARTLIETARELGISGEILDIGCGEGYYSAQLADALGAELTGLDISKEAVRCAAAKYKGKQWLCATAAHIPVPDGSADLLTSLFALTLPEEFHRVLKEGGYYFQVLAAEDHLLGLKGIIYPEVFRQEKNTVPTVPGFRLEESIAVAFDFTAEGELVADLLSMTPHFWRISADGARRLEETKVLHDRASCVVNVYRKENP